MTKENLNIDHEDDDLLDDEHGGEDDDHDEQKDHESDDDAKTVKHVESDEEDQDVDPEREAIKKRRREEREKKKLYQRQKEERLRLQISARDRELEELRQKVLQIESRTTHTDIVRLDSDLQKAIQERDTAMAYADQAAEANDTRTAIQWERAKAAAEEKARHLYMQKQQYEQSRQQQSSPKTTRIDPVVESYGKEFLSKHNWVDLNGADDDSKLVLALDSSLKRDGLNPASFDYWEKLENLTKKYLPHRFNSGSVSSASAKSRKSIVASSGRESSSEGAEHSKLSPGQIQALKDSGDWDNPERRKKMIKVYSDYNKSNRLSK